MEATGYLPSEELMKEEEGGEGEGGKVVEIGSLKDTEAVLDVKLLSD